MIEFDIDEVVAKSVPPILAAEAFLGVSVHGVIASRHVVEIMIPLVEIEQDLVVLINRMDIIFKGKRMRADRIREGRSEDGVAYRGYGFAVPEIKRGPTEEDYRNAKSVMRDIARDYSASRYAPTSILLEAEERRSQEKMVVEAPVGSGRNKKGFEIKTRRELLA